MKKDHVLALLVVLVIFVATCSIITLIPPLSKGRRAFSTTNFPGYGNSVGIVTRTNLEYRWRKFWGAVEIDDIDTNGDGTPEIVALNRDCNCDYCTDRRGSIVIMESDSEGNLTVINEITAEDISEEVYREGQSSCGIARGSQIYLSSIASGKFNEDEYEDIIFSFKTNDSNCPNWWAFLYTPDYDQCGNLNSPSYEFHSVENEMPGLNGDTPTIMKIDIFDVPGTQKPDILMLLSENYSEKCVSVADDINLMKEGHIELLTYNDVNQVYEPVGIYSSMEIAYPTDIMYFAAGKENEFISTGSSDDGKTFLLSQAISDPSGSTGGKVELFWVKQDFSHYNSTELWTFSGSEDRIPLALAKGELDGNDANPEIVIAIEETLQGYPLDYGEESKVTQVFYVDPYQGDDYKVGALYDPATTVGNETYFYGKPMDIVVGNFGRELTEIGGPYQDVAVLVRPYFPSMMVTHQTPNSIKELYCDPILIYGPDWLNILGGGCPDLPTRWVELINAGDETKSTIFTVAVNEDQLMSKNKISELDDRFKALHQIDSKSIEMIALDLAPSTITYDELFFASSHKPFLQAAYFDNYGRLQDSFKWGLKTALNSFIYAEYGMEYPLLGAPFYKYYDGEAADLDGDTKLDIVVPLGGGCYEGSNQELAPGFTFVTVFWGSQSSYLTKDKEVITSENDIGTTSLRIPCNRTTEWGNWLNPLTLKVVEEFEGCPADAVGPALIVPVNYHKKINDDDIVINEIIVLCGDSRVEGTVGNEGNPCRNVRDAWATVTYQNGLPVVNPGILHFYLQGPDLKNSFTYSEPRDLLRKALFSMGIGDFNHDGCPDVAVGDYYESNDTKGVALLLQKKSGSICEGKQSFYYNTPEFADTILPFNSGGGVCALHPDGDIALARFFVAAGDINGNGWDDDLVSVYHHAGRGGCKEYYVSYYENNGVTNGIPHFKDAQCLFIPHKSTDCGDDDLYQLTIADIDKDGCKDILVPNINDRDWISGLTVFYGGECSPGYVTFHCCNENSNHGFNDITPDCGSENNWPIDNGDFKVKWYDTLDSFGGTGVPKLIDSGGDVSLPDIIGRSLRKHAPVSIFKQTSPRVFETINYGTYSTYGAGPDQEADNAYFGDFDGDTIPEIAAISNHGYEIEIWEPFDSYPLPPTIYRPTTYWHVDSDATGTRTGESWQNAFTTVQAAVEAASSGDIIMVAEGTYASTSTGPVLLMKDGIKIYGGFIGTEANLSQRGNPADHPTILDGNEISYHVVIGASNAVLDGFTVTRGRADPGNCTRENPDCFGAGMANHNICHLTIAHCIFTENYSRYDGSGMVNDTTSNIKITSCIFSKNTGSSAAGAGFTNSNHIHIAESVFEYNNAFGPTGGGLTFEFSGNIEVRRCHFKGNTAYYNGGGMDCEHANGNISIVNCLFEGNSVTRGGGGFFHWNSSPVITNCTFFGNHANFGGALDCESTEDNPPTIVTNSIMWGNTSGLYLADVKEINCDNIVVNYSDIDQDGYADSNGNINQAPLFANVPVFNDFSLGSVTETAIEVVEPSRYIIGDIIEIGYDNVARTVTATTGSTIEFSPALAGSTEHMPIENWGPGAINLDEDLHLDQGSPCIDVGISVGVPDIDLEGNHRPNGSGYDLGAYEYYTQ